MKTKTGLLVKLTPFILIVLLFSFASYADTFYMFTNGQWVEYTFNINEKEINPAFRIVYNGVDLFNVTHGGINQFYGNLIVGGNTTSSNFFGNLNWSYIQNAPTILTLINISDNLGNWSNDKSDYWNKSTNLNISTYNITTSYQNTSIYTNSSGTLFLQGNTVTMVIG